jgi:hypothetical protein
MSQNNKQYKNNRSAQVARQIARNRARNAPRLKHLKETFGCHVCGRCDVDGDHLDGHHYDGGKRKFRPLAQLLNRNWQRIVREILGLDRDKPKGGGPVVMWCQRFHEDYEKVGHHAKPCTQLMKEGFMEPERVPTRNPKRKSASR